MIIKKQLRYILMLWAPLIVFSIESGHASDNRDLWILVDTSSLTVSVMSGNKSVANYENISLGRGGATESKIVQDGKTPLGNYRIRRLSYQSKFHIFIGIDYPTVDDANRGLVNGLISNRDYTRILNSHKQGKMPPQTTKLGGYLGLHGIGNGENQVHQSFNWTQGCVALSNDQIDDLATWVFDGMKVVVK